ncbi:PREDICTED: WD repeat-containing protein mio-A-like [Amphimedon queenslandica]|uniref:WD repeat protein mio zinc-ribbon like domain-containing protein n=1 Tax=Amphimedon queenslandica TaxID=400682 RepID=A0AAN0JJ94_AMPQE|nr:PREDICTED: WD repeat-containing protein mio-A-like [Amphimedon queenslandica]|eukprot:XP_019856861.1 PREDICTED: WD repeat-containing protein mio-A-like [Amphimedon queenslandica]
MATERLQVIWSPVTESEFATYGNELRVYNHEPMGLEERDTTSTDIILSSTHRGRLIGANSEVSCSPGYQTVAWQPNKDNPHFFAVGQSNGKVSLLNLLSKQPILSSHGFQLVPKSLGRLCHCVAWNPNNTRLLAEGLEKSRSDSSLIVWDITHASTVHDRTGSRVPDNTGPEERSKFYETGHGESTSSLSWLQENALVAGMGSRFLKVFDIREEHHSVLQTGGGQREFAQHKAIYGLTIDPNNGYQLASYAEGSTVYLWDIRSFQRPMYSFQRSGTVLQLSWLATRPGSLSAVFSESPYLRIIDIPFLSQGSDIGETYTEYFNSHISDRCPLSSRQGWGRKRSVVSLQWNNHWLNTGLITNNEGKVQEIKVSDKTSLSWGSGQSLIVGSVGLGTNHDNKDLLSDDISVVMRKRVEAGYGFNIGKNIEVTSNDVTLSNVWTWINIQVSSSSDSMKNINGVNQVLDNLSGSTRCLPSSGFVTYSSAKRSLALDLCGWSFCCDNNETLDSFLKREEFSERYERAAAIAVFQGNLKTANDCLKEGAEKIINRGKKLEGSLLNLIALSLSGYTSSEQSLWQRTCYHISEQITDPYLRAIFTFLCSNGDFNSILQDDSLMLQDRVAFACTYLEDKKLKEYVTSLKEKVISSGNIEGIFLTGLNNDGISLLAQYVNKTGDVQTACFICTQVLPAVNRNRTVHSWFEGYRDLLDQWKLWNERAHFDHQRKLIDPSFKLVKNASILCTFCSKAITSDVMRQDRSKGTAKKSTSCPSCRKPLPRCALCLLHMVAGTSKGKDPGVINSSDQFGQWFTWCQTCRHGGHALHIKEWFQSHNVCPVTDCSCHCLLLDGCT